MAKANGPRRAATYRGARRNLARTIRRTNPGMSWPGSLAAAERMNRVMSRAQKR